MIKNGSKDFYEVYAKLVLVEYYNKNLKNAHVLNTEKPDIQDLESDIGIEVTISPAKSECIAKSLSLKIFKNNLSTNDIDSIIKNQYKTFDGYIEINDNHRIISPYKNATISTQAILNNTINAINKKIKKFTTYKKFKENDLYVFTGWSTLNTSDIEYIMDKINSNFFEYIFIDCIDKIYICNKTNIIKKIINNKNISILIEKVKNYKDNNL